MGSKVKVPGISGYSKKPLGLQSFIFNTTVSLQNSTVGTKAGSDLKTETQYGNILPFETKHILKCNEIPKNHFYTSISGDYALMLGKPPTLINQYSDTIQKDNGPVTQYNASVPYNEHLRYLWKQSRNDVMIKIKVPKRIVQAGKIDVDITNDSLTITLGSPGSALDGLDSQASGDSSSATLLRCRFFNSIDRSSSTYKASSTEEDLLLEINLKKHSQKELEERVVTRRWPQVFEFDDDVLETLDEHESAAIQNAMAKFTTDIDLDNEETSIFEKTFVESSSNEKGGIVDKIEFTAATASTNPEDGSKKHSLDLASKSGTNKKQETGPGSEELAMAKKLFAEAGRIFGQNSQQDKLFQNQILSEYDEFTDNDAFNYDLFVVGGGARSAENVTRIPSRGMELLCTSFELGEQFSPSNGFTATELGSGNQMEPSNTELGLLVMKNDVDGLVYQLTGTTKPLESEKQFGIFECDLEHVSTFSAFGFVVASKNDKVLVYVDSKSRYIVVAESHKRIFVYRQSNDCSSKSAVQNVIELPGEETRIFGLMPMNRGCDLAILSSASIFIYKII
ncbi:hypothetical protein AYI68_g1423 [Smittium mucronatum]|uniref:NudC domain-containing protein 1 n=1 Tax=Smittium mucronatum TaxID=133383 RepID=A0A1R0H5Q7_9FUNG|nr:hypothetical protein AYI68_g1423 [Smittium mucronatum]